MEDRDSQPPESEPAAPESPAAPPGARVKLRILRQQGPDKPESRRWEHYEVPLRPGSTLASALLALERRDGTGERVSPPSWDGDCLEGTCGGCAVRVNGQVRLACTTELAPLSGKKPIRVEPLSHFALVEDLCVDRSPLFDALRRMEATAHVPAPEAAVHAAEFGAAAENLARCIGCGACVEACPQSAGNTDFVGPAALHHAHYLNQTPAGKHQRAARLDALMAPGGIGECGKAQNCVEVCPVELPLVDSIAALSRHTSTRFLLRWLLE
jgi:succinate dehydrogenase / fumarate reductase iron-sulfur subunit